MWAYDGSQYDPSAAGTFDLIPVGDHRVRIANVEEATSKTGKQMLKITLDVSGYSSKLFYYLVFLPENPAMTNQRLGELFDSFGLQPGNMNFLAWRGKVGAAKVKHRMYNDAPSAQVSWFILRSKQGALPAWRESAQPQQPQTQQLPQQQWAPPQQMQQPQWPPQMQQQQQQPPQTQSFGSVRYLPGFNGNDEAPF